MENPTAIYVKGKRADAIKNTDSPRFLLDAEFPSIHLRATFNVLRKLKALCAFFSSKRKIIINKRYTRIKIAIV